MKTLRDLGVIENKPSDDKISHFLIDSINIADSQLHVPTITATLIIERSTTGEVLSPTIEDEIDSFITSDVENNDNEYSETLDLIDSACKNIKYRKIKDILLWGIKIEVSKFMQNEMKQKLNLHTKEE